MNHSFSHIYTIRPFIPLQSFPLISTRTEIRSVYPRNSPHPTELELTTGNRDGKSVLLHAQIGTEYFVYRKHKQVGREIMPVNLVVKLFSQHLLLKAQIDKTRSNMGSAFN